MAFGRIVVRHKVRSRPGAIDMNQKKGEGLNTKLMVPVLVVGILAALAVGFLIGKQGKTPATATAPAPGGQTAPPAPGPRAPAAQQNQGLSAADLAKSKNVPAVLKDPAGDYQIVAVVEGVEANRKLTQNLQLVGAQRQRLLAISQEFDRLPAEAVQQRELLAGEINQARQTLVRNLQFMAQNYGYSLQFNYRLVPHVASLLAITEGDDGKPASKLVHRFEDASCYERFQIMREKYLLASVTEAKKAQAEAEAKKPVAEGTEPEATEPEATKPEATKPGATKPEATEPGETKPETTKPEATKPKETAPELSPELQAVREELITSFTYDPLKNYQVNLEKTALYARPGGTAPANPGTPAARE